MHSHVCEKCGTSFSSTRGRQRFCTEECRGFSNRTTANQYSKIDGNLPLYLNRLLYKHNNVQGKNRDSLTREDLLELWQKQNGQCAIGGIPLTYRAKKDEWFPYNASIDCVIPRSKGGKYEVGNIQLVCTIINSLVQDYSKEVFVEICLAVATKFRNKT